VHDITCHFVWITNYRYSVLTVDIGIRIQSIIREVCMAYDLKTLKGVVSKNHIHLLVSSPPHLAPIKISQLLKGRSSFKIQQEFPELKKDIGDSIYGPEDIFVFHQEM
jgi:putative transposase